MVVSARKFGSLYGYEVNGDAEVDLESANKWARSVLSDYKLLEGYIGPGDWWPQVRRPSMLILCVCWSFHARIRL